MGREPSLEPFANEDRFLRRVSKKRHIRRGLIQADAFDDKHPTLSLTLEEQMVKGAAALDQYREYHVLPHGDLPGICALSYRDLTIDLEPPLPPREDPDSADLRYGHLHCCTDRPCDTQREKMATLAACHFDVLRELVPAKKRRPRSG